MDCGCTGELTVGAEGGDDEWVVIYCPLHAAAGDMLSAVKLARWHLMTKARKDPEEQKVVRQLMEAYAKATGGQ